MAKDFHMSHDFHQFLGIVSRDQIPENTMQQIPATKPKQPRRSRVDSCLPCGSRRRVCNRRRPSCNECVIRGLACVYGPESAVPLEYASHINRVATSFVNTILPATPADPFDVLPLKMSKQAPVLLHHFLQYRSELRDVVPNEKLVESMGLPDINATWLSTALCIAGGHVALLQGGSLGSFEATFAQLRINIIQTLRQILSRRPETIPLWTTSTLPAMILAESGTGDFKSVEVHIHGLLALMKAQEPTVGPLYSNLVSRLLVIGISVFTVGRHQEWFREIIRGSDDNDAGDSSSTAPPLAFWPELSAEAQCQRWSDVGYKYTHLINEFLRHPLLTGQPEPGGRRDELLLRWLYSNGEAALGTEEPGQERALNRIAVASYAVVAGGMRWDLQRSGAEAGTTVRGGSSSSSGVGSGDNSSYPRYQMAVVALREWLDVQVDEWLRGPKPVTRSMAVGVLHKIIWLTSAEGIDTTEGIWRSALPPLAIGAGKSETG